MMNVRDYIMKNIDSNFEGELPFRIGHKEVKAGYIFTDFNQKAQNVYFLKTGIVQIEILRDEELKILDFFFKDAFFASYSSLLTHLPSDVCIKAITDCTVEIINYQELKMAYSDSLIANKLGRSETEKLYLRRVMREKQLFTQTAQQNYQSLIEQYPEVIQHIPLKDIAKYLGITPESLSRIRKKIMT